MIVEPLFTVGDMVRDLENPNTVFEVIGIETSLIYDREEIMYYEVVEYVVVDVMIKTMEHIIVTEEQLVLTGYEDVRRLKSNLPLQDIVSLDISGETETRWGIMSHSLKDSEDTLPIKQTYEKEETEPREIDDILDEYSDYQTLIGMFGDEDGEYSKRLGELTNELSKKIGNLSD